MQTAWTDQTIDIVMTATQRVEIVERTLRSFALRMFTGHNARLIINVDPVGPDGPLDVIRAAWRRFPVAAIGTPAEPCFPAAFKWVWEQTRARYVFHLEDDWELLREIDVEEMVRIMESEPDLATLRLPWKPTDAAKMKNWRYFFPWNGRYFECPGDLRREVGFCGHPSLIRGEFVRRCAPHLDPERNPEKQFHRGPAEIMAEVDRWRFGVYGRQNESPAIRDIGRKWMIEQGLRKAGNKAFFTHWEEIAA